MPPALKVWSLVEQVQLGLISKVLNHDWQGLRDAAAKLAGGS